MADALTNAWQQAERTGDYSQIASLLGDVSAGQLMSQYGLSNQDIAYINNVSGAGVSATPQEASSMLWDTLRSDPAASYSNVLQAGRNLGLDDAGVELAYRGVGSKAFDQQFGRSAADSEIADALYYLTNVDSLNSGLRTLNNTQEGYNYDTNDIIAAYRETFGRNPTQEEYVGAMATLGIENFDRASLGNSGAYTAATVAALESDPYAGRFAGYNPYNLPQDAANVSRNILGDQVQYVSPITQRPVVSSFDNGQLQLQSGRDVFTPKQVETAIALATATGGLTPEGLQTINDRIGKAKTVDDLYAAFSAPQAVASLGAGGVQTGVGQTYDEAVSRGFGGIDMDALYKALYQDSAPYKMSDTMTSQNLKPTNKLDLLTSTQSGSQLGAQQRLNLQNPSSGQSQFRNLGTFGAAGGARMGAGGEDYQSDLIKSLRDSSNDLISNNTGVTKYNFMGPSSGAGAGDNQLNAGGAFNPSVINQDVASADDVSNWNDYSTYRTNALTAKTPISSFEEWLAGGKVSGIPEPVVNLPNTLSSGDSA